MNEYIQKSFTGERAQFAQKDARYIDCIFEDGESPLKESRNIELINSSFKWKYPLWYAKNVTVKDGKWFDMARAGVWYTEDINIEKAFLQAPKNFRRCNRLSIKDALFTNALETLWHCKNVTLENVSAKGDYFALDSSDMVIDGLKLDGNYSFDGVKNVTVKNSTLLSKDAFWNSENVTVENSYICGEYLGWNAKNLTLINCTIESLQGMCYIDNLVMKNCKLINTTLAFEYSFVEAEITSKIDSVLNPSSGTISALEIGELILERDQINPENVKIVCDHTEKKSDIVSWRM